MHARALTHTVVRTQTCARDHVVRVHAHCRARHVCMRTLMSVCTRVCVHVHVGGRVCARVHACMCVVVCTYTRVCTRMSRPRRAVRVSIALSDSSLRGRLVVIRCPGWHVPPGGGHPGQFGRPAGCPKSQKRPKILPRGGKNPVFRGVFNNSPSRDTKIDPPGVDFWPFLRFRTPIRTAKLAGMTSPWRYMPPRTAYHDQPATQ